MTRRAFRVAALWDAEAGVWYSESDIDGLVLEAATLEAFEAALFDVAAELIAANHGPDLAGVDLASLTPAEQARRLIAPVIYKAPAAA